MKKKLILMGIAGACVITAIVGGTLAAKNEVLTGKAAVAPISTKELGIAICDNDGIVGETTSDGVVASAEITTDANISMPGTVIDENNKCGTNIPLKVKNITEGYAGYIRVHIYRTWKDDEKKKKELNDDKESVIMSGWDENWIKSESESSPEDIVLYYKYPVDPGAETTSFLTKITINENLGNDYMDKYFSYEVDADAVQALPAEDNQVNKDGIMSAWGMVAEFVEGSNQISKIE